MALAAPDGRVGQGRGRVAMEPRIRGWAQVAPCTFELTITAENCDASRWLVELRFDHLPDDRKQPKDVQLNVRPFTDGGRAKAARPSAEASLDSG